VPVIASDGVGGAILVWQDIRGGVAYDIYAQRILASGAIEPGWPVNGRAVCAFAGLQVNPRIVPGVSGSAIIAWQDMRPGTTSDVYAQRILSDGTIDASWPVDGLPVCTAAGNQAAPAGAIISDGSGGAIVAWLDARADTSIYAQHILASGQLDPAWPTDGLALGADANYNEGLAIVEDGHGGAIVAWADFRTGATADIYAQHILASGSVDPAWPVNGRALCVAAGSQLKPTISSDGAGGAIVAWQDPRSGNLDIYAQHVLAEGSVDPAWPVDGSAVCDVFGSQQLPKSVGDGAGGAIVCWQDFRGGGTADLYIQHVLASGVVDPGWAPTGLVFCGAVGTQQNLSVRSDGAGGAIATWDDSRVAGNLDVYAHHILATGSVDFDWPQNGRCLSSAANSQNSPNAIADGSGGAIVVWIDSRLGGATPQDIYAQRVQANGQLGGTVVDVPRGTSAGLALYPVFPNPSRGEQLSLRFELAHAGPVSIELLDTMGRRVTSRELGVLEAGRHSFDLYPDSPLAPGIYLVRLRKGAEVRMVRSIMLR